MKIGLVAPLHTTLLLLQRHGPAILAVGEHAMWLHELGERPFTRAERRFLSRAGRANVPLDVLMERVEALVGPEQPTRGRPAFLTKCLLDQRLFSEPEEARAFAESYYELAKAGSISKYLLWDWE